jgi:outer membrane protein assembly factor BamA
MLGNQQLVFAGYVNGRLLESQVLAAYTNLAHRTNYTLGVQQQPYFFFESYEDRIGTSPTENTFVTNIRRIILRSAFAQASHPFSRFQRLEAALNYSNVSDANLEIQEPYDNVTGIPTQDPILVTNSRPGINFVQPSLALVFDNSLFGYVGPFYGRRYRFEVAQNLGDWRYTQLTADYRRYDKLVGPFTLATRVLYFGRIGRDAQQFQLFGGSTDLIRGNTSGSYQRNECANAPVTGSVTGCAALDRLVGTQVGVASAELRFPLLNAKLGVVPSGFPPVEGALFYDVGVVRDVGTHLRWSYAPGEENDPTFRAPLQTVGASLRINVLGFVIVRVDYSHPLHRPGVGGLWAVSLGPTF